MIKNYCDYCAQELAEFYWGATGVDAEDGVMCCYKCSDIHGLTFILQGFKCVSVTPSKAAEQVRVEVAQDAARNSFLSSCTSMMPKNDNSQRTFQYDDTAVVCTYVTIFNSLKARPKLVLYFRCFDKVDASLDSYKLGVIDLQTWTLELLFEVRPGDVIKEVVNFIQGEAMYYMDTEHK